MNTKQKGSTAERELIHKFWKTGTWAALRAAGSGSTQHPCPDLIASNGTRILVIECKSVSGGYVRVEKEQAEELKTFATLFGAETWVGARYAKDTTKESHGEGWYFFSLEDLRESEKGYSMNIQEALYKGLSFEELINLKISPNERFKNTTIQKLM